MRRKAPTEWLSEMCALSVRLCWALVAKTWNSLHLRKSMTFINSLQHYLSAALQSCSDGADAFTAVLCVHICIRENLQRDQSRSGSESDLVVFLVVIWFCGVFLQPVRMRKTHIVAGF